MSEPAEAQVDCVLSIPILSSAIDALHADEPLLATTLTASFLFPEPAAADRRIRLNIESYDGGSFHTAEGEGYRHRALFVPRADGSVGFKITVTRSRDGDVWQFVGGIHNEGRTITYDAIHLPPDRPAERTSHRWEYVPPEEAGPAEPRKE